MCESWGYVDMKPGVGVSADHLGSNWTIGIEIYRLGGGSTTFPIHFHTCSKRTRIAMDLIQYYPRSHKAPIEIQKRQEHVPYKLVPSSHGV